MQRDEFCCRMCCSEETTLNVHHRSYEKGRAPWDYPLTNFVTLCEVCHNRVTNVNKQICLQTDFEPHLCALEQVLQLITDEKEGWDFVVLLAAISKS